MSLTQITCNPHSRYMYSLNQIEWYVNIKDMNLRPGWVEIRNKYKSPQEASLIRIDHRGCPVFPLTEAEEEEWRDMMENEGSV